MFSGLQHFMSTVPLFALLVSLLALCVTIWLAYRQVKKQRQLTADRATLNFIADREIHNPEWRRIEAVFFEQMNPGEEANEPTWKQLINPSTRRAREDAIDVRTFLNHYELVAIGITEKIINERLYADWYKTSYVRIWQKASAFVCAIRKEKDSKRIYCNLEEQAKKWQ